MAINLLPYAIAALVAGTAAQQKARHDQKSAAEDAYRDWSRRSRGRTEEATDIWEKSMAEQDVGNQMDAVGALAQEKVNRVNTLTEAEAHNYDPILAGQERAPAVVKTEIARNLADELAKSRAQIKAQATLEGFSGRSFDRGLQLSRSSTDMGNLGIFAQGDRNIFDSDMLKAQSAGQNWAMIGDILTTLGQVGMLGAGMAGTGSVLSSSGTSVGGAAGGAPNAIARLPVPGMVA